MEDKNGSSVGWALASFLLGAIFGTALALILTPESSSETRDKLRETIEKSIGAVSRKAEKILEVKRKGAPEEELTEEETQS